MGPLSCGSICYRAICAEAPRKTVKTSVRLDESWYPGSKSVPCLCDVTFHHDVTSLTRRSFHIIYFMRFFMLWRHSCVSLMWLAGCYNGQVAIASVQKFAGCFPLFLVFDPLYVAWVSDTLTKWANRKYDRKSTHQHCNILMFIGPCIILIV